MSKKKKQTEGYPKGVLTEKIRVPDPHQYQRRLHAGPFLFTNSAKKQEDRIISEAQAEKLPTLFDYFKISQDDPDKWQRLALLLASKHVTGF